MFLPICGAYATSQSYGNERTVCDGALACLSLDSDIPYRDKGSMVSLVFEPRWKLSQSHHVTKEDWHYRLFLQTPRLLIT